MKKGISFFSLEQNINIKETIEFVKKCGYHGIEPIISENGYLNLKQTDTEILKIKEMAKDNGLEIFSVGVWMLWDYSITTGDKKIREEAENIIRRELEIASLLGANTVLVVPGSVGNDFSSRPEKIRYDYAYERAQESISKLVPLAEKLNVNIGIENVWNKFLLSPIEFKRFLDEINSKNVGAYFDIGNIMYVGYPEHWIEILDKHIKKIHICDYRTSQAGLGAFVDLLAGDVDFRAVMNSIRKIGYDDYITLEMLPNYKDFPYQSLKTNKLSLDFIVDEL